MGLATWLLGLPHSLATELHEQVFQEVWAVVTSFFFFLIKDFIYLFMRDRERDRDIGRGRSRLPEGSWMQDLILGPQDHNLS